MLGVTYLFIFVSLFLFLFFFFSSRRRHTRSTRDWSSDVCSSDLADIQQTAVRLHQLDARDIAAHLPELARHGGVLGAAARRAARRKISDLGIYRSEERRVGKECRCRWARYH